MTLGQTSPGKDLKARYLFLGSLMMLGLLVLCVRLYRLQVTHGEEFSAKSVANFVKEVRLRADRGTIKDARGEILAENRPSFDVFITPAFCQKCTEEVLPKLAGWFSWDHLQTAALATQIKQARRSAPFVAIPVRVDVSRDELDVLSGHLLELPGVEVTPVQHRSYPRANVLAHVLGYMNEVTQDELDRHNADAALYGMGDYIGRRGIERSFEKTLRGTDGFRKEVVNARGEAIPELNKPFLGGDQVVDPHPGNNIILSIDLRLQQEAEMAFPGEAGVVVVVDVHTGFILALVSRPSFDPNVLTGRVSPAQMAALTKDPLQPMIFRPAAQHYSPGSTFKVVTALAALRSKQFPAETHINCPGGYRLGRRTWRCWNDHGHGLVDAKKALQVSCDTYYYKVADVLGLDPIAEVGKELGLGSPTGIGVVAEVPGIMPDTHYHERSTPGGYAKGMALNAAIGQGDDNVTPLQLAMLYSTIANGGTLWQPQLVKRIESAEGAVLQEFQPRMVRQVNIEPEHRKVVVDALTAVVHDRGGTAYGSRLKDVLVAGKTGTAQVARLGSVRLKKEQMTYFERDHAWFAAFAPANSPDIAVVVLNEHGGHGGSDAAPAAMKVIQKYWELKQETELSAKAEEPPPPVSPPRRSLARTALPVGR